MPRDDRDIIVPLDLQPVVARPQGWRGRSSSLVAVGLVAFVAVAVVLGAMSDDRRPSSAGPIAVVSSRPTASSPRPTARPTRSREPLATPLPEREVLGGQIPTERRLVYAAGLELLDLATGSLTPFTPQLDFPVASLPNSDVVCACVVRDFAANDGRGSSLLRFGRYEQTGKPILERDLQSFDEAVAVPDMTEGFNVAASLDPDGKTLNVLVVERRPPIWTIGLRVIDVETGTVRTSVEIGQVPVDLDDAQPSPSASPTPGPNQPPRDGIFLWAESVAAAPGARSVFVSVGRSEVRNDNWTGRTLEWMVDLDPDGEPTAIPVEAGATLVPNGWCVSPPAFVDAAMLVQVCATPAEPVPGAVVLRRIGPDGTSLGAVTVDLPAFNGAYPMSFLVDRSARAAYLWQLQRHVLARVDVDSGVVTDTTVPESLLPEARPSFESPGYGRGYMVGDPGMVLSADGRRVFAVGIISPRGDASGQPSGVWVFDSASLELLDHWEPRAFLTSLAISGDGRFLYAASAAGIDVDGRENPWPATVTVYDAATGEIQVVYGQVSPDSWISFLGQP
jgi:hypothetical protein